MVVQRIVQVLESNSNWVVFLFLRQVVLVKFDIVSLDLLIGFLNVSLLLVSDL